MPDKLQCIPIVNPGSVDLKRGVSAFVMVQPDLRRPLGQPNVPKAAVEDKAFDIAIVLVGPENRKNGRRNIKALPFFEEVIPGVEVCTNADDLDKLITIEKPGAKARHISHLIEKSIAREGRVRLSFSNRYRNLDREHIRVTLKYHKHEMEIEIPATSIAKFIK